MKTVGVKRFAYGRSRGWFARISRKSQGVVRQKMFSDAVYGGTRKAWRAAVEWREAQERELGPPQWSRAGNDVGLPVGTVRYTRTTKYRQRRDGGEVWVDVLEVRLKLGAGRWLITRWSVDKHGLTKARRECRRWVRNTKAEHGL